MDEEGKTELVGFGEREGAWCDFSEDIRASTCSVLYTGLVPLHI